MSSQPRPPMPILPLSSPDTAVTAGALSLLLAALYSPDVLTHVDSSNAPTFLATAVYFGLTRFADLAYQFCEESVRKAKTPDEIAGWVAYVERDGVTPQQQQASGSNSNSRASTPLQGMMNGGGLPMPGSSSPAAARGGNLNGVAGGGGPPPASYEGRLLAVLLDRILRLPSELGAFVSSPTTVGPAQAQLVEVLKPLPFDIFKRVIEDSQFEVPSDMDRCELSLSVLGVWSLVRENLIFCLLGRDVCKQSTLPKRSSPPASSITCRPPRPPRPAHPDQTRAAADRPNLKRPS